MNDLAYDPQMRHLAELETRHARVMRLVCELEEDDYLWFDASASYLRKRLRDLIAAVEGKAP